VVQPAVKPLYDTRNTGDVFLQIAKKLGGSVSDSFPWGDFREVISHSVEGIFDVRAGTVFTDPTEEEHIRLLETRGWWTPSYHSFREFWKALLEKGGWWDPVYFYGEWRKIFETPSKKFEFFSQQLLEGLEDLAGKSVGQSFLSVEREKSAVAHEIRSIVKEMGIDTREDLVYLPHYESPRFSSQNGEYPLHLNPYELLLLSPGDSSNQPWLMEIVGAQHNLGWESWVEINPATARVLGISDGDRVWIESSEGRIETRAKLFDGAMPGVVNMPLGLGHRSMGRWAKGRGVNPFDLIVNNHDYLSGLLSRMATKVKVYKA
jgi:anaerobic selenocysteine-containing dehydrogenase